MPCAARPLCWKCAGVKAPTASGGSTGMPAGGALARARSGLGSFGTVRPRSTPSSPASNRSGGQRKGTIRRKNHSA